MATDKRVNNMNFLKKYWYLLIIATITIGLGVVVILTTQQLTKTEPVAPTVAQVKPKASEQNACTLSFDVATLTTPTPTPTPPPAPVCPTNKTFSDISSSSAYYTAVTALSGSPCCTIGGTSGGTFLPDSVISRAETVVFLANYHVFVLKDWTWITPTQASFTDVPLGHWAFVQIETAKSKGFIAGNINNDGTKSFIPNDPWKWGFCGVTAPCTTEGATMTRGQYIQALYDYGKTNSQINACLSSPAACNNACTTDAGCQSGLICSSGMCKNISCTDKTDCKCSAINTVPNCTGLTVNPSTGGAPLSVTFTCSGVDTDGDITAAEFTFGDGQQQTIEKNVGSPGSESTTHTFTTNGTFNASCRVRDNNFAYTGSTSACQKTITVGGSGGTTVASTPKPLTTPTPIVPVAGAGTSILGATTIAGGILLILLGLVF